MALRQADTLVSNNPSAYGVVKAVEVAGHKTVPNLTALFSIPDCILSESGNNSGQDSIGQKWYVISEKANYILDSWEDRKSGVGWRKEKLEYTGGDIKLTGYTPIPEEIVNDELIPTPDDTVNEGIAKLHKSILDNEEIVSTSLSKIKDSVGLTENLEYKPIHNLIQDSLSLSEAMEKLAVGVEESGKITTLDYTSLGGGSSGIKIDDLVIQSLQISLEKGNPVIITKQGNSYLASLSKSSSILSIVFSYIESTSIIQETIKVNLDSKTTEEGSKVPILSTSEGNVYRVKGTKEDFSDILELTDAKIGDVWNVVKEFTISGKKYAGGTNVVCIKDTTPEDHTESSWDPLGGEMKVDGNFILEELKKVDGSGSGLDSDLLGGIPNKKFQWSGISNPSKGCLITTELTGSSSNGSILLTVLGNSSNGSPINSLIQITNVSGNQEGHKISDAKVIHLGKDLGEIKVFHDQEGNLCLWFKGESTEIYKFYGLLGAGTVNCISKTTDIEKPAGITEEKIVTVFSSVGILKNKLTFSINTGTSEGTDKFTFDGSSNKVINFKNGTGIELLGEGSGQITISGKMVSSEEPGLMSSEMKNKLDSSIESEVISNVLDILP